MMVERRVCSAATGTRVYPVTQSELLKISPRPTLNKSTLGSLQQEVMLPVAEQHQLLSLQRYRVLVARRLYAVKAEKKEREKHQSIVAQDLSPSSP